MATDCKPSISKPIGLTALAGMVLIGFSKPALYRRIHAGAIPVLAMPGECRISVAGLEQFAGRPLSPSLNLRTLKHAR